MTHLVLIELLILGSFSPEFLAQADGSSVQAAVTSVNEILRDRPDLDPSIMWRRQWIEVDADQLMHYTVHQNLDGSVLEFRSTARTSDVKGVVGSAGVAYIQCRNDAPCVQLWSKPFETWVTYPVQSRAIFLSTSATGEMADQLVTRCRHLVDLLSGSATLDANDPPAKRPK